MPLEDDILHELEETIQENGWDYEYHHENKKFWNKFPKIIVGCLAYFGLRALTGHLFGGPIEANGEVFEGPLAEVITQFVDRGVYTSIWTAGGFYALFGAYSGINEHFAKKSLKESEDLLKNMSYARF